MMSRLRALEPEDVDMMYELENDPHLWAMGATNVPYSRKALEQFIDNTRNDIYADTQVRLVVEDGEGRAVGLADLFDLDARNLHAEVAIAILPGCRRQGVGTEAMRELTAYAVHHLGLRTLTATTAATNTAARRLLDAAGFSQCGRLKDYIRISTRFDDAIIYQYDQL